MVNNYDKHAVVEKKILRYASNVYYECMFRAYQLIMQNKFEFENVIF